MTRSVLSLGLFLFTASTLLAQQPGMPGGSVGGLVLDDIDRFPIEFATIAVRAEADSSLVTGGVTNTEGVFAISSLRSAPYIVEVSFVGYRTQYFDIEIDAQNMNVDLGTIYLETDEAQLGEAQVTGQREFVEVQIDRTTYNVADQPINSGGNAADVLQNVPSIEVDIDGNVSLRGNQNVAILINGRNVPVRGAFLAAFLRQLPGDAIDRVEVIPNPSARFDPDGMSGVINIILKEGNELGLSGGVQVGGGTNPGADASANVSYQKGPWNLYTSYGFRYDNHNQTSEDLRENLYLNPTNFVLQNGTGDRSNMSHLLSASADYTLTRGSTLSLSSYLSLRDNAGDNGTLYTIEDESRELTQLYERITDNESDGLNMDFSLGFKRSFDGTSGTNDRSSGGMSGMRMRFTGGGGPSGGSGASTGGHELSLEVRFNRNTSNGADTFTEQLLDLVTENPTGDPMIELNESDDATNEGTFQVDYVRPFDSGLRLEAGGKSTVRQLDNTFAAFDFDNGSNTYIPNLELTNAFTYDEQVHAAYGILARQFGDVGVQAGVRVEQALTDFTLENTDETFENDYFSVFPSAFATYAIAEGRTIKASYSRRINRPHTRMLNPFASYEDPLNLRVGNPELKPEYTDAFEVTYTQFAPGFTFNVTPFYRRTTDVFRRLRTLDEETGVSTTSFENFDTNDSYGLELVTSARFGERLNGFLSFNGYQTVTNGTSTESDLSNSAFQWNVSANATIKVREGTSVQLFGFYRAPFDIEQGRISSFSMLNLALKQDFSDRLSLSLRASDVFDTMQFNYQLAQPQQFNQEATRRWGARNFYATLSYTFGNVDRTRQREQQGTGGDMGGGDMGI